MRNVNCGPYWHSKFRSIQFRHRGLPSSPIACVRCYLDIGHRQIEEVHFRRRMRHRIHPVRHRVSLRALCLAASVMVGTARCETWGKLEKTGKRKRKRKAYAPVTWRVMCGVLTSLERFTDWVVDSEYICEMRCTILGLVDCPCIRKYDEYLNVPPWHFPPTR